MKTLKIFRYLDELDCFVVTDEYRRIADDLGLTEWSSVVWIGRLFTLDNDYGEHWFDNWDLRDEKETESEALGVDILIIDPSRQGDLDLTRSRAVEQEVLDLIDEPSSG